MKYDGARESRRHRTIKTMLETSLKADKSIAPESVRVESTVRARNGDWREWRRPDVQALWKDRLLALEIQLSTTFLTVIAARREFYQRNGGLLLWIFDEQVMKDGDMRFTERDVFYNNNSNLFYVTIDTVAHSIESGDFHLMCRWEEPVIHNGSIITEWREQEVALSQLQPDFERQRVYYFDFDRAYADRRAELQAIEAHARAQHAKELQALTAARAAERTLSATPPAEPESLRYERLERERLLAPKQAQASTEKISLTPRFVDPETEHWRKEEAFYRSVEIEYGMTHPNEDTADQFGNYWIRAGIEADAARRQAAIWHYYVRALWEACPSLKVLMPIRLPQDYRELLCALYSLREGCVIGLEFHSLQEVENRIFTIYRHYYRYFAFAIRAYGQEKELKIDQPGSTCHRHIAEYKANRHKTGYKQYRDLDPLISFLFPELR